MFVVQKCVNKKGKIVELADTLYPMNRIYRTFKREDNMTKVWD